MSRIKLGDLMLRGSISVFTGPFGSALHASDYIDAGVPVIPTEAVGVRRLRPISIPRISQEKAASLARYAVRTGDIVFARRGVQATGLSAILSQAQDGWLAGTGLMVLRVQDPGVDPEYLSFFLSLPSTIAWLKSHAVGAVMPNLNSQVLAGLEVDLPDLNIQRKIADILSGLDDKIDLNRRMNQTLEATTRAMFKSWFVDFDPVREGRAGFPESFEDSAAGRIPRGWKVASIGELVEVVGGSTPSTAEPGYWGGLHSFATPKDMAALTSPVLLETERRITDAGVAQISSNLLSPGVVLLSSRAPIGYLAISEIPVAVNQGFIAMICDQGLPNFFVLEWARHNMDVIKGRANGTTFPEISKRNFRPIHVVVPPEATLKAYMEMYEPLYRRIVSNLKESRTLAALRDTLLPKLLSGEIRVKQAEKMVGEAV